MSILASLGCYNKYYRVGCLNNKDLCVTVLETGKSKIQTDLVSGKDPLPGLQMAACLLYPHMAERMISYLCDSSYKGTSNSIHEVLPSWLNYLPKAPPPVPTYWKLELQNTNWGGGHKHLVSFDNVSCLLNRILEKYVNLKI